MPAAAPGELVVSDDDVRAWVLNGSVLRRVGRFHDARLQTERLSTSGRPMLAWALRLMARDRCYIADAQGLERDVTLGLLLRWSWQVVRETMGKRALLRRVEREVDDTVQKARVRLTPAWNRSASPLYLRTDLSFGVRAGGSVGHIAGVLNELADAGGAPILLTTAPVPTVRRGIEVHHVAVPERFWNFRELPAFVLNDVFFDETLRAIEGRPISFVYQRYSLNNYAGLRLAHRLGVPFVLEYNGSEIWMSRHWGRPLQYEALASRIELLNVNGADLVVVVSRAMRDELVARGVDGSRVLVNPNAVDPDRYSPAVDGSAVRRRLGLDGRTVLGFISTFQPWHGAVVLARAFVALLNDHPEHRDAVRLLMIGSGRGRRPPSGSSAPPDSDDAASFHRSGRAGRGARAPCGVRHPGVASRAERRRLAVFRIADQAVRVHGDGEGIVASNLDQIGEVLRHGETAWLVPPGDVGALAAGLDRLVRDADLRASLGAAARRDVLAHHTWRAHVRRTLEALDARVHASAA